MERNELERIYEDEAYKMLITVDHKGESKCEVLINSDYYHLRLEYGMNIPGPLQPKKKVLLRVRQKKYKKDEAFKAYLKIGEKIKARLQAINQADERAEFIIDESLFDL